MVQKEKKLFEQYKILDKLVTFMLDHGLLVKFEKYGTLSINVVECARKTIKVFRNPEKGP